MSASGELLTFAALVMSVNDPERTSLSRALTSAFDPRQT